MALSRVMTSSIGRSLGMTASGCGGGAGGVTFLAALESKISRASCTRCCQRRRQRRARATFRASVAELKAGPVPVGWGDAFRAHVAGGQWRDRFQELQAAGVLAECLAEGAIPSAAWFLQAHGAAADLQAALLAFNHSAAYLSDVLSWAARYAAGGAHAVSAATGPQCQLAAAGPLPAGTAGKIIAYAEAHLGKPYQWGATGPDAFDCSGLAMMAYRAAGVYIPRTSQQQWQSGTRIPPPAAQPGDLVFFAGSDGTPQAPGHVGIVTGHGEMIEAYATGYPIRISTYGMPSSPPGDQLVVGVTHPS